MKSKATPLYSAIIVLVSLILVFLILGLRISSARAESPFGGIKTVKNLPIQGVKLIESDKGTFFVSENGRFAWKGPIYDLWNGKNVATIEDADTVVNHIDIKKIGLDPDKLATLTLGKGDKEEIIFVSTDCPHCRDLLQQAVKLGEQYRFKVVMVPMGQKSMEHTKQILCTKDQQASLQALVSGKFEALGSGECGSDLQPLQHTLVAARILGLRSVPFMIRHDGKVQTGAVKDLAVWLAGNDPAKVLGQVKTKEKEAQQ
ncbi:MAG: DsbC family protein [Desulfobaccales bacterium]